MNKNSKNITLFVQIDYFDHEESFEEFERFFEEDGDALTAFINRKIIKKQAKELGFKIGTELRYSDVLKLPTNKDATLAPSKFILTNDETIRDKLERHMQIFAEAGLDIEDAQKKIEDIFGFKVRLSFMRRVLENSLPYFFTRLNRKLSKFFPFVHIDLVNYFLKVNKKLTIVGLYYAIGINKDGRQEFIGAWIAIEDRTNYYKIIFKNLKDRGVENIAYIITSFDNPTVAERSFFKKSIFINKIIFQIKSLRIINNEVDRKKINKDLLKIYDSTNKKMATSKIKAFGKKWKHLHNFWTTEREAEWKDLDNFWSLDPEIKAVIQNIKILDYFEEKITKTIDQLDGLDFVEFREIAAIVGDQYHTQQNPRIKNWCNVRKQIKKQLKEPKKEIDN